MAIYNIELTREGKEEIAAFIAEAKAKRKEILDAGKDEADMPLFTADDIVADIAWQGEDEDGAYVNDWAVTDNYDTDAPLCLMRGIHYDYVKEVKSA